jgi:hypothetical protein
VGFSFICVRRILDEAFGNPDLKGRWLASGNFENNASDAYFAYDIPPVPFSLGEDGAHFWSRPLVHLCVVVGKPEGANRRP